MSRNNILIAVALLAVLGLGGLGYYLYSQRDGAATASAPAATAPENPAFASAAAPPAAKGPLPDPIFLVLNKQAVMRFSKAGQDLARQAQPLVTQAQNSIQGQRASLEKQAADLRQDASISDADREKRGAALQAKAQSLQVDAERRQQQLSDMIERANAPLSKAMSEIIPAITKAHGANIVLDRAAVAQADPAFDITPEVIAALDAKIPTVTLTQSAPLAK